MSFGGGGSGALPNHEHTNIALDGGPLDFVNTTIASLTANSMTYSDGAALQELTIGSDAQVLAVSGGSPAWITNTSNPLVKVTKTFSDIDIGTTSMDIYTLPEDSALVNVWADITTVFDVSTGVTVGDAADPNGFQESTDWTSGTGLTDATRGAYVTSFKTMMSTTGTTAIKAYDFSTATAGGTTFSQTSGGSARTITNGSREELAQQFNAGHVLVGEIINHASWWIHHDQGSPTGNIQAFIRQADGTLRETSSTTVDASTVGASTEYTFNFAGTTTLAVDDMICIALDNGATGANQVGCATNAAGMTNGTLWQANAPAGPYTEIVNEQMKMTVLYGATITTDTQGAVDFYLQVVN